MKRLKRLGQLLLVALVFMGLSGLLAREMGGYALFVHHHWTVEMPLVYAGLLAGVGLLLLSGVFRVVTSMFYASHYFSAWQRKRRLAYAQKKTKEGLFAFVEGAWAKSEKALMKGAKDSALNLMNYLVAATVANEQQRYRQSDDYLGQACNAVPEAKSVIELTQAYLLRQRKQYEQAILL